MKNPPATLDLLLNPDFYTKLAHPYRFWGVSIPDLAQDLALYCQTHKTKPTSTLAHSLAVDQVRSRARYTKLLVSSPTKGPTMPEILTDVKDELSSLLSHTKLSSDELQVLHLHVCLDLTYDQVSDELGLTKNQVKHHLQQAMEKLRKTSNES